jgi:aerobic-type carbon monoxide dehydrogenase small subunit (CoxS/CutS family)
MTSPRLVDEDGKLTVRLTVNGTTRRVKVRAHHTLLEVLRDELGLFGTREGCGIGMCGACTVLWDGKPVSSCLKLAALSEERQITTIEGLEGARGELTPTQQAFSDHTAFQCSYCTPGFVITATALLQEQPGVTRAEASRFLAGNLCRCGSYVKILDAVMDARDRIRAQHPLPPGEGDAGVSRND